MTEAKQEFENVFIKKAAGKVKIILTLKRAELPKRLTPLNYFLCGEPSHRLWSSPLYFPLLQAFDETRVGFHAGSSAFYECIGCIEGHSVIADKISDNDSWAT